MKKYFALLLAGAMIFSSIAFAAADANSVGQKLKTYGVIKGDERGLRPEDKLSRQEALVTLIRMLGEEEAALENVIAPSFIDVAPDYWAKPYIGYAQSHNLTNGIGDNMFGVDYNVTTQQCVAFMLRALGYGEAVPYDQSMIKGTQLGLLNDMSTNNPAAEIKRGDMFILMMNTLHTKPMGEDLDLIYKLGIEKVEKEEPKKEEPKKEEPKKEDKDEKKKYPSESSVDRVVNNGLKQLLVYFDAPVKSSGDESNYRLSTKGDAELDENSTFTLSKDGMYVTIDLTKAASNQDEIDLKIKGVADNDEIIKSFEILDNAVPEIEEAVVIGEKMIKIVFSEPMNSGLDDKNNYQIKSGKGSNLSVRKVEGQKNNTIALIETYSSLSEDSTIKIKNIKDYAGYRVESADFDLDFSIDDNEPEIEGYTSTNLNHVTLIFDEDIKLLGDASDFWHTNRSNKAKSVKVNGNKLTLEFARNDELPKGTAYIYIDDDAISDYWNNKNEDRIKYEVDVEGDRTEPSLKGDIKVVNQREVILYFDEDIEEGRDYEVDLEKNGKDADVSIRSYFNDSSLRLKFGEDLYGEYELLLEGIEDTYGNEIDDMKVKLDMDDETGPDSDSFTAMALDIDSKYQKIIVDFKEEMKESDIKDLDKYQLDGKDLDSLNAEIEIIKNDTAVEITIPSKKYDLEASDLKKGNQLLEIARMADAAGNKMDNFSVTLDITDGDEASLEVKKVALTSRNKVEFTIDGTLDDININQFKIFQDGDRIDIDSYETDEKRNQTILAIELDDEVSTNPKADDLTYEVLSPKEMEDDNEDVTRNNYGQKLAESTGDIEDKCPPELKKVVLEDEDTIYLYFTEDLDEEYFSSKGRNGFDVDGGDIDKATLEDGNIVKIKGSDFTRSTDVIYEDSNIYDKNGNELESFEYTSKLSRD